ncbi:MAG: glycoside hydrolase family 127 protein [Phycisphaerales bacterium]|nr:glycoside hydrolase family 127 protein [Phycisphaerales bacterium]
MRLALLLLLPLITALGCASQPGSRSTGSRLTPVSFTDVHVTGQFWADRIETNRRVTIPYEFDKCDETGRLSNFAKAGGLMPGEFEGIYYNDSDVYKVIEGAAYSLADHPDAALDAYLDDLIKKIAAAQQHSGYLNTYFALVKPDEKWTNLARMHELYCAGHLFEAAVAHYQATGKRSLFDVAIKLADHIDSIFGPGQRHGTPGHQEIEIGLVKLYRVTGEQRYLDLAKFFLDERGHAHERELFGRYAQDHKPVVEQTTPVGHAVRAMYLYCGMADVAALTGDDAYLAALHRIWDSEVQRKLYITGGIGARREGEAFGEDYELPNGTAYNETCAAIGNALWNHRMNLLFSDAKYADVLERVIYNGFLSGVSLSGDRFFYPNPLSSPGSYHRSPWFSCSCCPVNVVRFLPSIPGYVYAHTDDAVYVNLYIASQGEVALADNTITLVQETDYPWDGVVKITVQPKRAGVFDLALRIPGWVTGSPVPSDLYAYCDTGDDEPAWSVHVNGEAIEQPDVDRGYVHVKRPWQAGDTVTLDFPMPVRFVTAHEQVQADRGRVAMERGPIVYCIEAADTDGHVRHLYLPRDPKLTPEHRADLLGGVTVLKGVAIGRQRGDDGSTEDVPVPFTAVPYAVWDHREPGEMAVWIPIDPTLAEIMPQPTLASTSQPSTSHCFEHDTVMALNDQIEPTSSSDQAIPRLTWWDHLGTEEWARYDFPEPWRISYAEVYWFDDTGRGQCRLPESWRLLYLDGDTWKPVTGVSPYGVEPNTYNRVNFDPIETTALRLEVKLQDGFSGGILEWRIN